MSGSEKVMEKGDIQLQSRANPLDVSSQWGLRSTNLGSAIVDMTRVDEVIDARSAAITAGLTELRPDEPPSTRTCFTINSPNSIEVEVTTTRLWRQNPHDPSSFRTP